MGELIECCLDGCPREQLATLLDAVSDCARGEVVVEFHEDSTASTCSSKKQALERLLVDSSASFDMRIAEFVLGPTALIHPVVLQVFPVEGRFDLFLNFRKEHAFDFVECIGALNGWTSNVRRRLGLSKVYCGMDPADDEKTRYFTNGVLGPLFA